MYYIYSPAKGRLGKERLCEVGADRKERAWMMKWWDYDTLRSIALWNPALLTSFKRKAREAAQWEVTCCTNSVCSIHVGMSGTHMRPAAVCLLSSWETGGRDGTLRAHRPASEQQERLSKWKAETSTHHGVHLFTYTWTYTSLRHIAHKSCFFVVFKLELYLKTQFKF